MVVHFNSSISNIVNIQYPKPRWPQGVNFIRPYCSKGGVDEFSELYVPKQQQFYNTYYDVIKTEITYKGYYKQTKQSALTIVSVITYDYVIIQFKITGCQNNVSNDTYRKQMLSINQKITGNPVWELEVQNGEYVYLAKVSKFKFGLLKPVTYDTIFQEINKFIKICTYSNIYFVRDKFIKICSYSNTYFVRDLYGPLLDETEDPIPA
jgi:hypothetical protein